MNFRTKKQKAFDALPIRAQLQVQLNKAPNEQQKFILYIEYASIITKQEVLNPSEKQLPDNQNFKTAVMNTILWYLNEGMNPDIVDEQGFPALSHAIFAPDVVELLLSVGANPNLSDEGNYTPLHKIASSLPTYYTTPLLESTKFLVMAGANPCLQNKHGDTPLESILDIGVRDQTEIFREKFLKTIRSAQNHPITRKITGWAFLHREKPALPLSEKDIADIALFDSGAYELFSEPFDPVDIILQSMQKNSFFNNPGIIVSDFKNTHIKFI